MNIDSIRKRVETYQADGRTGMVMSLDVIQALLDRCQETLTPKHKALRPLAPHPGTQVGGQDLPPYRSIAKKFAEQSHIDWSRWMKYIFRCGQLLNTGQFAIDANKVERWQRQMQTPYQQLPYAEQNSDRANAHRYLKLMAGRD